MIEVKIWDLYFSQVVAMSLHPGYNRDNTEKLTIAQCAEIANQMLIQRNISCQSPQQ